MASDHESSSSSGTSQRGRNRARANTQTSTNSLRPSPALVTWIDRAVSSLTAETPWRYEDKVSPASPLPAQRGEAAERPRLERTAVPAEVRDRFVRLGRDYYFASGAKAFRDHGTKVVTQSENIEVIRSLVQIALARGWQDITVSGSERFLRDAWRIATLSGLVVRGYKPTEFEKQKFVRELAAAREPRRSPEPLIDSTALGASSTTDRPRRQPESGKAVDRNRSTGRRPEQSQDPARDMPVSARRERVYTGTLLEHRAAPYEFHHQGEPSYFVRIETVDGPKVLWGKDLQRALEDAKVQPGDEIHLRQTGRQAVTVTRKERDSAGRVLTEHDLRTHRNQWDVRRSGNPSEKTADQGGRGQALRSAEEDRMFAREHPEVHGALLALKGAQLFAEERIKDAAQRSAFVNAVREQLVHVLDRGDVVPVPPLRQRTREPVRAPARTLG